MENRCHLTSRGTLTWATSRSARDHLRRAGRRKCTTPGQWEGCLGSQEPIPGQQWRVPDEEGHRRDRPLAETSKDPAPEVEAEVDATAEAAREHWRLCREEAATRTAWHPSRRSLQRPTSAGQRWATGVSRTGRTAVEETVPASGCRSTAGAPGSKGAPEIAWTPWTPYLDQAALRRKSSAAWKPKTTTRMKKKRRQRGDGFRH